MHDTFRAKIKKELTDQWFVLDFVVRLNLFNHMNFRVE